MIAVELAFRLTCDSCDFEANSTFESVLSAVSDHIHYEANDGAYPHLNHKVVSQQLQIYREE